MKSRRFLTKIKKKKVRMYKTISIQILLLEVYTAQFPVVKLKATGMAKLKAKLPETRTYFSKTVYITMNKL